MKAFQEKGNIPDMISWPMYIKMEFIPGNMKGEPDQNLETRQLVEKDHYTHTKE